MSVLDFCNAIDLDRPYLSDELYGKYLDFCGENLIKPASQAAFNREVTAFFVRTKRRSRAGEHPRSWLIPFGIFPKPGHGYQLLSKFV
jgi:hypothetical protein